MYIFIYIYISLYVLWSNVLFESSRGGTCDVSMEAPCRQIQRVSEGPDVGQGARAGRLGADEDLKVHCYALPSSTLTAWGLMAPVRAGLACPAEVSGSWSLLVMPPGGVLPSPTALRTSRMVLFCSKGGNTKIDSTHLAKHTFLQKALVSTVWSQCLVIKK